EYAFEYLMSGGENSLHVVMGLQKPDDKGELVLRPKPYAGKFFMSGAAAGRVFVFDLGVKLDPAQYHGNVVSQITPAAAAWRCGSKASTSRFAWPANGSAGATKSAS